MDRLKVMESFVCVAESGSLVKAAKRLGISRALVSSHLKQLEDHIGCRLVNRTTRQLALTEVGQEYLVFCRGILAAFDAEDAALSRWHEGPRGQLKIVASYAFGNFKLAPIIADFLARHPEVSASLILTDTHVTPLEMIERGYDLAFTSQALNDASIITAKVGETLWLPCAARSYLRRSGRLEEPEDLAGHACLNHRSIAPDGIWRFTSGSREIPVKVSGPFVTNSVIALKSLAQAGRGVALLPTYALVDGTGGAALERVLPAFGGPLRPIFALYPHAEHLPKKVRTFLDFTKQALRAQEDPVAGKSGVSSRG
jgi:DNA-binding transcriptional LysR family regulator